MSLYYVAAAVWFALALGLWSIHPSDLVWLLASVVWAVVFFGVFIWGLARKAEAEERHLAPLGCKVIDAPKA
jgi:hypothetical protein